MPSYFECLFSYEVIDYILKRAIKFTESIFAERVIESNRRASTL